MHTIQELLLKISSYGWIHATCFYPKNKPGVQKHQRSYDDSHKMPDLGNEALYLSFFVCFVYVQMKNQGNSNLHQGYFRPMLTGSALCHHDSYFVAPISCPALAVKIEQKKTKRILQR